MSEYLGFIAVIPRGSAEAWVRRNVQQALVPIFLAFVAAWKEDQPLLPDFGRYMLLHGSGLWYIAQQYTTTPGNDKLAIACRYKETLMGPEGRFQVDVTLSQNRGAVLTQIVPGDIDVQIKNALCT